MTNWDSQFDKLKFDGGIAVTFGERLYELRKSKNISQEEMAELLDVSRQSISKWENDKAYPEMTRLLFMSEYFDVSLDYLMRGTEEDENRKDVSVSYKAKNMLLVWNNFVSNLSSKQRKLLIILYVLLVCVCVAIVISFLYGVGYAIGQFIAHIQNDLNL
jgi:transcriptional regulator with XRE-family HTH domain